MLSIAVMKADTTVTTVSETTGTIASGITGIPATVTSILMTDARMIAATIQDLTIVRMMAEEETDRFFSHHNKKRELKLFSVPFFLSLSIMHQDRVT